MAADALTGTFLTAQAAFTERVHAVAGDQWRLGTPDAQWTVADPLAQRPRLSCGRCCRQ